MGRAKSFVNTGGAETVGEDATGLGMEVTMVMNPELGVKHRATEATVANDTMVCCGWRRVVLYREGIDVEAGRQHAVTNI